MQPGPAADRRLHVKISPSSVPPDVRGDCIGEVLVYIDSIDWKYRGAPEQTQLRISWWGEGGAGTVVPLHPTKGAGATFPVVVGPKYLCKYFRDMGNMVVAVEDSPSGRPIGSITIPMVRLDAIRPVSGTFPLAGPRQQLLAECNVHLAVTYTGLSSFEFNEHRASADPGLPTLPTRAPPLAAAPTAAPAASAKAAASGDKPSTGAAAGAAAAAASGKENAMPQR